MTVLALQGVSFDHGGPPLLDGVDFAIEDGERLALVGRNGTGKSTLLAILAGEIEPGHGRITRRQGLRVRRLVQTPPPGLPGSIDDLLRASVQEAGHEGWMEARRLHETLRKLMLDGGAELQTLSAGTLRRALLAAAIAAEPDLLLLDEPTNHLDLDSICAVEDIVRKFPGAVVFVSHDRRFIETAATGIVELDRGRIARYPVPWSLFLERREAVLDAEEKARAEFDKALAGEEAWIRRGVKARRARNMGRVRNLLKMREEHRVRRERAGVAEMRVQPSVRGGDVVVRTRGLSFAYGERQIVRSLDLDLRRGDRLGVVGPNGCGKSTVVKLLLGELAPGAGTVHHGTNLTVAWFEQQAEHLDPLLRVQDAISGGASTVGTGTASRHVVSYLSDFLFTPEQCRRTIATLSGGERSRLLLARLFARPMNLLVLDEPTNDLDIETLELLENVIAEFPGTLILVSHDRTFLDNVVTSTIVHEGDGRWKEYDGGFSDYERARAASLPDRVTPRPRPATPGPAPASPAGKPRRLGHKERRELDDLPRRIEALEAEQAALHATMAAPSFFKQEGTVLAAAKARLDTITADLSRAYERWAELMALE